MKFNISPLASNYFSLHYQLMSAHDTGMTFNMLNHHLSQYQAAVYSTGTKLFNIFHLLGYNIK